MLSRTLQTVNQDLFEAIESVEYVLTTVQRWREGADDNREEDPWEQEVDGVVCTAHTLLDKAYIVLTIPRLASKQTARSNVAAAQSFGIF